MRFDEPPTVIEAGVAVKLVMLGATGVTVTVAVLVDVAPPGFVTVSE